MYYNDTHNLNCANFSFCLCCFGLLCEVWVIDFQLSIFLLDHLLCLATLIINFIQQKRIEFITKLHNVLYLNNLIMIYGFI